MADDVKIGVSERTLAIPPEVSIGIFAGRLHIEVSLGADVFVCALCGVGAFPVIDLKRIALIPGDELKCLVLKSTVEKWLVRPDGWQFFSMGSGDLDVLLCPTCLDPIHSLQSRHSQVARSLKSAEEEVAKELRAKVAAKQAREGIR